MTSITHKQKSEQLTVYHFKKVIKQVKNNKPVDIKMSVKVINIHLLTAVTTKRDLFFFWNEILSESLLDLTNEERDNINGYIEDQPISNKTIRVLSDVIYKKSQYSKNETSRFLVRTKEKLYREKLKKYDFKDLCNEDRKTNWLWCYIRKNTNKKLGHLIYKENIKGNPTKEVIFKDLELNHLYLQETLPNTMSRPKIG
ncbi:hypothetical protein [Salinivibrio kushneri]|uniref:Uncharacterized protein n=1 Tax=Salinivibrio kushneri TaxID=1908198 RepID=A0AA47KJM7_9GAMM|nr:hypothetical protein [Salinivibrio kushneri]WBA08195.1 hypothetical protein N8M53_10250 [Salinivibrio kushneri]